MLTSSLSVDSNTLSVTYNFSDVDLHASLPELTTPLKLRFNNKDTLYGSTYTFEKEFVVANICPSTCGKKWLLTKEAFNFTIQSDVPGNLYDLMSFDIDSTDYSSCQFYNHSIVNDTGTIKELSQNATKYGFYMKEPYLTRGTTTVVVLQTHANCWGQTKTFTLTLERIKDPEPVVVVDPNAINIEEKLVATPDSEYEVILG